MLPGDWLDQTPKAGAVKVQQSADKLPSLRGNQVQWQIVVLKTPTFLEYFDGNNAGYRLVSRGSEHECEGLK